MLMMMIMFTMSILMIWMKHPLSMGLILLIQTINMSLYLGFFHLNYWFSYILFLIMIGGMLILFIYMTNVASNEMFYPSMKFMILLISILFLYMITNYFINTYYININNNYNQIMMMETNLSLTKYFNYPNHFLMYLLISYLLIALLAIVKITDFKKNGTLRSNY
uniref:NADH-ubiquinone oxidoreductase chain 6 n=1 Tax=Onthophagus baolocensis TaxID=1848770 RepID=A0A1X9HE59_9SCAR|nr:NADH deshydrogenase subunit 6 [Onthophagus baolocensis]